jgi:3-oxoacyl-[acyl-carrier-protein] synthase II
MHEMKNEMKVLDEEVRYMNEPHSIVETVSKKFLLNGNHLTISAACAGGNYAITNAFDLIRYGECQFAVAGATTTLTMLGVATFSKLGILTNSLYCPFDKDRKGILFGEGSGMLVLEEYEHAIDRGVKIYAEVLGYGITCDAYHLVATEPSGTGAFIAMEKALKMADLSFNQIDYVSAHGTGTIANDSAEVKAIHQVFGENLMETPCSSIKSMIGHSLATSSAMEAVICCKVLENNILPPTINFQTPDPECDIDCVPNDSREKKVNIVMNNSFGFGGYNCITILKKI